MAHKSLCPPLPPMSDPPVASRSLRRWRHLRRRAGSKVLLKVLDVGRDGISFYPVHLPLLGLEGDISYGTARRRSQTGDSRADGTQLSHHTGPDCGSQVLVGKILRSWVSFTVERRQGDAYGSDLRSGIAAKQLGARAVHSHSDYPSCVCEVLSLRFNKVPWSRLTQLCVARRSSLLPPPVRDRIDQHAHRMDLVLVGRIIGIGKEWMHRSVDDGRAELGRVREAERNRFSDAPACGRE